jgi:hypothetical protein
MYLPSETDVQVSFSDINLDSSAQSIPNVTKEISDILKLCDAAGLEPHGLGCGMSVHPPLTYGGLWEWEVTLDCICAYSCGGVVGCRVCRAYPCYRK